MLLGLSSPLPIPKVRSRATFKIQTWITNGQRLAKSSLDLLWERTIIVITDYGTGHPYNSMTPLISGEIGEDFAYFLTDSQQTPSAVGLNVLLDEEDKVKVAGGFLLQVLPVRPRLKLPVSRNASKKCLPFQACWLLKTT